MTEHSQCYKMTSQETSFKAFYSKIIALFKTKRQTIFLDSLSLILNTLHLPNNSSTSFLILLSFFRTDWNTRIIFHSTCFLVDLLLLNSQRPYYSSVKCQSICRANAGNADFVPAEAS